MDIKAYVDKVVAKVKDDPEVMDLFKKDPIAAVEKILGVDLPDGMVDKVVDAVKSKISLDSIGDKLGGIGKLFG